MQACSDGGHEPTLGENSQPQAEAERLHQRDIGVLLDSCELVSLLGKPAGQPVTMKVAKATLPLWRPLAWKVSSLPG
jgi:hypothetical protein